MTPRRAPRAATWILEHWVPGGANESLTGDLVEEFAQGQPTRWYWRQVLVAALLGYAKQVCARWPALLFAVLWSGSAPALELIQRTNESFEGRLWQLDWPWSTVCYLTYSVGLAVLYIWTGLLLFVTFYSLTTRRLDGRRLVRGMLLSVPLFAAAIAGMTLLSNLLPARSWIDMRQMTWLRLIAKPVFYPYDAAFCFALAIALCIALPRGRRPVRALAR